MRAEIIAVGSELLLGQILNSNAKFISLRLAEIGIDVNYHTVVGDNPKRLEEVITIAKGRADILIFTGGLGPTKDDLTKETIAKQIGTVLVSDDTALRYISDYFDRSGRTMSENNKKQALVFEGSQVLANHTGMAPGMAVESEGTHYILLPGPPHEMEPMFTNEATPYLFSVIGKQELIKSRILKFYGIGEAELEFRIQDLLEKQANPTIAPLASKSAVTLRITAKALSETEANNLIDIVDKEIRSIVGEFIYGIDEETLSSKAAELLSKNNLTLAAAESLTAGMFMAELADEPGISSSLSGGVVVYNNEMKVKQLGIEENLLSTYGAVSSECAAALAVSVMKKFGTDVGIGITGAAGPDPHDGKPVGTVWISIASQQGTPQTYKLLLSGLRNTNRLRASQFALYYLIKFLKEKNVQN
ncbi:competence/damage-inducible protein A [Sporosarcina sp. FA9]|uniref:competence/damage-inducible protein A n=1 Tax=Sporosarcina sp. FA9 TaxID=3413030 RepID=UPI003F659CFA